MERAVSTRAITTQSALREPGFLKQSALFFDRITVFELGTYLWELQSRARGGDYSASFQVTQMERLRARGIVDDPDPAFTAGMRASTEMLRRSLTLGRADASNSLGPDADLIPATLASYLSSGQEDSLGPLFEIWCRLYAAEYARSTNQDVVFVSSASRLHPLTGGPDRAVALVLRNLPVPDDATPWEAILEFREDEEARRKFRLLKAFLNRFVTEHAERPLREIEDDLLGRLTDYESHMRLHRLKIRRGVLQTIMMISAEIIDGITQKRMTKAVDAVFSVRNQDIQMLEAERSAPNRELAYLYSANERFPGGHR
jgi:hypothetical protein